MKLCPQCEFIYEDDQSSCDMDGESLVGATRLDVFPGPVPVVTDARPAKARLRIVVMVVGAGLVLSAMFSLGYYASSASLDSNFASRSRKPEAPEGSLPQQTAPPLDNSASPPAPGPSQSPTNPQAVSQSVSLEVDKLNDGTPFAQSDVVVNNMKVSDNRLATAKGLPPLPGLPPLKRLPAAKPEAKLQPANGNANKQSRVKAFLKKTGRN